jgi:hypothetical protein
LCPWTRATEAAVLPRQAFFIVGEKLANAVVGSAWQVPPPAPLLCMHCPTVSRRPYAKYTGVLKMLGCYLLVVRGRVRVH